MKFYLNLLLLIILFSANNLFGQNKERIIAKSHEGKWAFFDSNNNQLSPFEFDSVYQADITPYRFNLFNKYPVWFYKGLAVVQKDDQFAIINESMNYMVDWQAYEWISPISLPGFFIVKRNNKYGLIDYRNNLIQPTLFDTISNLPKSYEFQNSPTFWAKQGNNYLIFDTLGKWKDSIYYDSIKVLQANYYLVFKDTMSWRLDRFGNKIMEDFRIIRDDNDFNGFLAMKESKCGLVSRYGDIILPFEYENIYSSVYRNYYYVKKNGKWGLVNKSNELLLSFNFEFISNAVDKSLSDNLNYIVVQNGKFGKYNSNGQEIFPCIYDGITTWVEYGPDGHYVRIGNKYGLIDSSGNIVIPVEYEKIDDIYKSGLSLVYKSSKIGVFDSKNKNLLLPLIYDSIFISYNVHSFYDEVSRIVAYSNGVGNLFNKKGELLDSNITDMEVYKFKSLSKYYFDLCSYPLQLMIQNHTFNIPDCFKIWIKENGFPPGYFYYKMEFLD